LDERRQGNRVVAAVLGAAGAMAAAVMAFGLGSGGCFSPKFESCAVSCGEGSACPDDQFCLSDGKCHASQEEALCTPGGGDASADDGDDGDDTTDDSDDPDDTTDDTTDDTADDLPPPDGGPPDASLPDAGPPVTPTSSGDLVITEIHKDPTVEPDPGGEWFEVFNPTAQTFDMQGLRISDLGSEFFIVDQEVIVPPGGRVVFARVGNPDNNGGVAGVDFVYGKLFSLGNNDDEVLIENLEAATFLDTLLYDPAFPDIEGASMSLDPGSHDSIDNDNAENWCAGSTVFGDGDLGTPGAANPDC
jgi:hypothetical protein